MDFLKNFELVLEALYQKSNFMKDAKSYNFSGQEYATLMTNMGQLSLQTALAIEEAKLKERNFNFEIFSNKKQLDFKERELGIMEEKARVELEITSLNAKAQIRQNQAENIKSLVQAESISRSVGDNAAINQANAYVGFLNVMANAAELATAEKHAQNVISVLNKINTEDITAYEPIFEKLRGEAQEIINVGEGAKEVWVHTAKSVCEVGEQVKVMGFSVFGNNEAKFVINGEEISGKTILFSAEEKGVYEIVFKAKDDEGQWQSDSLQIAVTEKIEF